MSNGSSPGCPMCGDSNSRRSWLGSTNYGGRRFDYVACRGCESLYCQPMPDGDVLAMMYGPSYGGTPSGGHETDDARDFDRVLAWLRRQSPGTFLDFGCGAGGLLRGAQEAGWRAIGIEFDPEVAKRVQAETGARVATKLEPDLFGVADVVNVGDVVEHLTDPAQQMGEVLETLKPGGVLLAQGPLEANRNLLTWAVQLGRTLRPRASQMPPYHVTLATARGQRRFFERIGVEELEFAVSEVDWPAPSRLPVGGRLQARPTALFVVRKLSRTIGALGAPGWGNRYFFAGRRPAAVQAASRDAASDAR